jgi:type II secretory pathway component GspD/PulD (secretin)
MKNLALVLLSVAGLQLAAADYDIQITVSSSGKKSYKLVPTDKSGYVKGSELPKELTVGKTKEDIPVKVSVNEDGTFSFSKKENVVYDLPELAAAEAEPELVKVFNRDGKLANATTSANATISANATASGNSTSKASASAKVDNSGASTLAYGVWAIPALAAYAARL